MCRKYYLCAALAVLLNNLPGVFANELGTHVHGVATVQVAVDEKTMTLNFSSPLDSMLGFEHVARNPQQKAAVKNMADRLNRAEQLFIPTAEAGCTLKSVKLDSVVFEKGGKSGRNEEAGGHADLDGEFVFICKQTDKLRDLDVLLFDAFPHLHQLKVEVATLKKQSASTLTAAQRRASW